MKALSIRAPWAWCIMNAGKVLENRSKKTNYRGQLLIHVSKTWSDEDLKEAQKRTELLIPTRGQLNLGACIGIVDLVDCYYSPEACGKWGFSDCYHWVIKNPRPIHRFYHKGQLGLFDIPDNLIDFDTSKNPILEECGYKSKRGEWRVTVWRHPSEIGKYSYGLAVAGGVACGGDDAVPGHRTLFGRFDTPENALIEGIRSV